MKKFVKFLAVAALLATFSSCDDDNEKDPDPTTPVEGVISGDITEDLTLDEGKTYTLAGGVYVKEGVTLTIEPGVTVKNDPNEAVAFLLIERGGKIMAEGTAASPIVFTSDNKERGAWGGVIVNGYAPVNGGEGERTAEVGDVLYGGTDAQDNSGVLKYVRVEYTGNAINDEKEHNGFTFNGVGAGTILDNLQAYYGGDDGFEFFGGTVNATNLISTGSKDDSFDWTYGWSGNGTNWIAEQAADAGDRGIEADNNSKNRADSPNSNPTLSKITLLGRGESGKDGLKLREGTMANISDIYIAGFEDGIDIEHDETLNHVVSGAINISKAQVIAVNPLKYTSTDGADDALEASAKAADNVELVESNTGADVAPFAGWALRIETNTPENNLLAGQITENTVLKSGETYILQGGVYVKEGVTLTIEPGVIVKNDPQEAVAFLLIERGAKINAVGTMSNPIVFTSDNKERGAWGGIIINGYAPVNGGEGERTAEVGDVLYGGTDAEDNSGVLKYVRVEYTGNAINDEKEHNGFTLNGVGSGTVVENLQAYMGGDDGFEFFGGTVNATNLLSTGSKDDSFDWTYGWSGTGTNWVAEQADDAGDRGIEADNNSKNRADSPNSNPTLVNITLKGRGTTEKDGLKLREGTMVNITNIMITGFEDGIDIEHDETLNHLVAGDITITNANVTATNTMKVKSTDGADAALEASAETAAATYITFDNQAAGADESVFTGWTVNLQ